MNKTIYLLFFVMLFVTGIGVFLLFSRQPNKQNDSRISNTLTLGKKTLQVAIVQTPSDLAKGLGDTLSLKENEGMLFLLGEKSYPRFWMKDMRFPQDFIWIDGDKVADITKNVSQIDQQKIYQPARPVDKVLEVNAGFVDKYNIKIGDQVSWK